MSTAKQCVLFALVVIATSVVQSARAQEPINAFDSATQPSPGHFILKEQIRYLRLGGDPRGEHRQVDEVTSLSTINWGISSDVSLSLRLPVSVRWTERKHPGRDDRDEGVADVTVLAKWRIARFDHSPLDTSRISLLGGMRIRSGDSIFSSDSYDPLIGAAATLIRGRHGFNFDVVWTFTTGGKKSAVLAGETTADWLRYDAAYLYRLAPARYGPDTHAAWYAVLELNGHYETNGDHQVLIGPGLMYEARLWTWELSVQLPMVQELDHRPDMRFALVSGVRFSI